MRHLPMRPRLFVPAFIALFVLSSAASFGGSSVLETVGAAALIAAQALAYFWTWQALAFATAALQARGEGERSSRFERIGRVLLTVSVIGLVSLFIAAPRGVTSASESPLLIIALLASVLGGFGLFWTAAAAMCAAERSTAQGSPHVLGTFIQFVYLVLAVGFIYARLRRVAAASGG